MRIKKSARTCHTCEGCPALQVKANHLIRPDGVLLVPLADSHHCKNRVEEWTHNPVQILRYPARPDFCETPRSDAEYQWQVEAQKAADVRRSVKALEKFGFKTRAQARREGSVA